MSSCTCATSTVNTSLPPPHSRDERQRSVKACFVSLPVVSHHGLEYPNRGTHSFSPILNTMATRTITKTRTKTKTKSKAAKWDAELDVSEGEAENHGETSAVGHRRLDSLKAGSRRSRSPSAANSSFDLSNSSDEEAEDDFADDVRAEIRQDLALREEKKKNGGRAPRKKVKESKADKQTHHTRKLVMKGRLHLQSVCVFPSRSPRNAHTHHVVTWDRSISRAKDSEMGSPRTTSQSFGEAVE